MTIVEIAIIIGSTIMCGGFVAVVIKSHFDKEAAQKDLYSNAHFTRACKPNKLDKKHDW